MPAYLIFRDYGIGVYEDGRTSWSQVGERPIEALSPEKAIELYVVTAKLDASDEGPLDLAAVSIGHMVISHYRVTSRIEVTPTDN